MVEKGNEGEGKKDVKEKGGDREQGGEGMR